MQLSLVLTKLYPNIIWGPQSTDCVIIDGNITVWNTVKLGPQPTQTQLEAAWPAAQLQSLQAAQNALNYASYLTASKVPSATPARVASQHSIKPIPVQWPTSRAPY